MSGETDAQVSGWTVDTLKEHLEARLDALDRLMTAADENAKRALEVADEEKERRLGLLNEFRGQAEDQQRQFLPREVFDGFLSRFDEYKDSTSRALDLREGQGRGAGATISYLFAGIGCLFVVISIVLVVGDVLTK